MSRPTAGTDNNQPIQPPLGVRAVLGVIATVWLVLAAVELILAMRLPRSMLSSPVLDAPIKRTLMADELLGLALAVVLVVAPLIAGAAMLRRSGADRPWIRRTGQWVLFAVAWGVLLLFSASWGTFRSAGVFLAQDGLLFFATNLVQFTQHVAHMEPVSLLVLPLLVTIGAVGAAFLLPRLVVRHGGAWIWAVVALAITGVAACGWVSWRGERGDVTAAAGVFDPDVGLVYTRGDLYRDCRDNRTGPVRFLWADLRDRWWPDETPLTPSDAVPIQWRPIISSEQWVERVDASSREPLNVILVLIESLRSDQLTAYGSSRIVMPAVESVAEQGMVYLDHYTQSSHSNYADLCPLNSRYPLRSDHTYLYPEEAPYPRVFIYDLLHRIGYRTAIISSQNENWGGMINELQTDGLDHLFHADSFEGPTYVPRGDTGFEAYVKGEKRSGKIDDRFTVTEAIRWIDETGDAPFFIYMNLQSSHLPYETPDDFPRRFGRDDLPFVIRFNNYPKDQTNLVKDEYANSLAYVDFQLDRLFEHLRQTGAWDRTAVILTGDTGQAFYEHGFAGHANVLFDEVLRVPLVLRAPGLGRGTDIRPAQHIDVPPTILDLLGLPPHPSFQGRSLLGPPPSGPRSIYLVAQCPSADQLAIVRGGYKLIHDLRRRQRWLLHLAADPGESRFVEGRPEVREMLSRHLDTWHHEQLRYYRNLSVHGRFYPPYLEE